MATVSAPIIGGLRFQRDGLETSPLYRHLLDVVIDDAEHGGVCSEVLARTPEGVEPVFDALALRFLGGVHRIVLEGRAPDLASCYPSAGGRFDPDEPGDSGARFVATVAEHRDEVAAALTRSVQTNEVGRCAPLLLGFLEIARTTGLPLRLLEFGASAGLNLRWDRYRYEGGAAGTAWGEASSLLRFEDMYRDPLPRLDIDAVVAERAGCDRDPVDAASGGGALLLRSFVWPDQLERLAALEAALVLAPSEPVGLDRADAGDWLDAQLAQPRPGVATVVFHSIVWSYLPATVRRQVKDAIARAGRAATTSAPVAWLRMEPGQDPVNGATVTLTQWPDGREQAVARTGYHGRPVVPAAVAPPTSR